MSANRVKKFLELINERDKKIAEHCNNESWAELCKYPDERDWYIKNIFSMDEEIIQVANSIIAKFSIPCKNTKTLADVFSNKWLMKLIEKDTTKEEDCLSK